MKPQREVKLLTHPCPPIVQPSGSARARMASHEMEEIHKFMLKLFALGLQTKRTYVRSQVSRCLAPSNFQLSQFALTAGYSTAPWGHQESGWLWDLMLKFLALGLLTERTYVRLKTEIRRYFEAFEASCGFWGSSKLLYPRFWHLKQICFICSSLRSSELWAFPICSKSQASSQGRTEFVSMGGGKARQGSKNELQRKKQLL